MDGRERFLTVLSNQKPDRMPVQVHGWMSFYLQHYLDGADQYAAYEGGHDPVICEPHQVFRKATRKIGKFAREGPMDESTTASTEDHHHDTQRRVAEKGGGNDITPWVPST